MQISDIYTKYTIPPNLQDHMFRVAAVGAYISDHWREPTYLDRAAIVTALLFHDMGNIIKYDFKHSHLMGEREAGRIDFWKKIQKEFSLKYNNDEHVATTAIAKEVNIECRAIEILQSMGSSKLQNSIESKDWSVKVASYSDFRVDPLGVVTVDKRFDDIVLRYRGRAHVLGKIEETEAKRKRCLHLEEQL